MKIFSSQLFCPASSAWQIISTAALCLSASSMVFADSDSSRAQAAPVAEKREESVLVATREAPPASSSQDAKLNLPEGDVLEPIPQSSDYTPDVAGAGNREDAASEFGAALSRASGPKPQPKPTPAKIHAKSSDGLPDDAPAVGQAPEHVDIVSTERSGSPPESAGRSGGTARRAAAAQATDVHFEPVKFQDVTVGKTSKHELITAWGQPAETSTSNEGEILVYEKSPFKTIEALIGDNSTLASIKVTLASPLEPASLAGQLGLDRLVPVTVSDDADSPICLAYPERGVLFMFAEPESTKPANEQTKSATPAVTMRVAHVVLQPIDACAFAYRAESRLHGPYTQNINDLKAAIALDPELARAYWLLARIYIATGQADLADTAAAEACDIEPENASFQLMKAQARELSGEYDDAVLTVRAVLDREDLPKIDHAQALHQMARLASLGDREIAAKVIPFETRAIEIADRLATSEDARERRAAKQLLVEAHVGIAEEVARQPYREKVETLSQWLGRASGIAEEFITKDKGSVELRLYIAQRALNALSSFKPTLDPAPWVAEAEDAAKTLLSECEDDLWQQRIKWELGIAHLNALRVEHTRRQTEAALKYGQLAIDNLAIGASSRQAVHSSERLVGQLYFQMGAIYAVHKLDHPKAIPWYDKAAPLLTAKRPASELFAPRREGEMLVSMGVSYWQMNDQTKALEVTQTGVRLVETAVEGGVLAKSALAVPYSNLSTMYKQMGETTNAARYAEMAKNAGASEQQASTGQQQRVGRTPQRQSRPTRSR